MGVCCRSLDDAKVLMKMGLALVLVGHVNFLLGGLVHGSVLRDVKVSTQAATIEYAISNIIGLVSGLMAVLAGISAIVLSKNMKNQPMMCLLLVVSILTCLLGAASAVSITTSIVTAITKKGSSLLTLCNLNDTLNTYSITYECPFDPTRIYGTTVILWVLLVLMSVVEVVFSARCFAASVSFLRLSHPCRKRRRINVNRVRIRTEPTSIPPSPVYYHDEEEPTEQHDLLNSASPTEETSAWL
ncbi:transmembrane protein 54a [Trichomycterus rosablanca]|uniref:transmembrane protein 54a n=1 Tax=Trichomycterus rosablanca TaxID=2290929 RepID=UPI002F35BF7A